MRSKRWVSIIGSQIGHVLAEIGRLEAELGDGPLTVPASKGQPMPTGPAEPRQHRWLLVRLLDGAGPPGDAAPAEDALDALRRVLMVTLSVAVATFGSGLRAGQGNDYAWDASRKRNGHGR